jgi:hypothetical protein
VSLHSDVESVEGGGSGGGACVSVKKEMER